MIKISGSHSLGYCPEDIAKRRTFREFLRDAVQSYIGRYPAAPEGEYRPHERICGRCKELRIRCRCRELDRTYLRSETA